ncbi:hypothetical protein IGI66_003580 [Enterococcus sp. AZ048]|uniref:MucBP domain-containing protein n=1 Tax=Enterococcus sp. AZ048 TaxID=2774658 RepID=UPI003F29451C
MGNRKIKLLGLFLVTIICGITSPINTLANDNSRSHVIYDYVSMDSLTNNQKGRIIKGNPSEIHLYDIENYLFIYQREEPISAKYSNGDIEKNKQVLGSKDYYYEKNPKYKTSDNPSDFKNRGLPETGDIGNDIVMMILGVLLVAGILSGIILKTKRYKNILLIFIFFGSSSFFVPSISHAVEIIFLSKQESVTYLKGKKEMKSPEVIPGYNYIGYIHTFQNKNKPLYPKLGNVLVKYQDENGSTLIPSETIKGAIGKKFDTIFKNIEGYTFKESIGTTTGVFSDKTQVVTYVYTKIPVALGEVQVNYVNQVGDKIHEAQTIKGKLGDSYDASTEKYQLTLEGYVLNSSKLPSNMRGVFTDQKQEVTYVFNQRPIINGEVLVNYTDQDGKTIHESQVIRGKLGDFYNVSTENYQLNLEGYVLDTSKLPNNIKGNFLEQKQEVTFVYTKKEQESTITIKFLDLNGNPFTIYDLSKYKEGSLIPIYPKLDKYKVLLDYNQKIYSQGEQVSDILLSGKLGEHYQVPEEMKFTIIDDEGNEVPLVGSVDNDGSFSGIRYWINDFEIPTNREGVFDSKNIVIYYRINEHVFSAPPDKQQ